MEELIRSITGWASKGPPVTPFGPTLDMAALGAVEAALNAALTFDPDTLRRLAALKGKVIALELPSQRLTLCLTPRAEGLRLMAYFDGVPDATLSGTLAGFLKLGGTRDGAPPAGVTIQGDVEVAHQFLRIAGALDFQWEEHLSHLVGDALAHEAGNLVRGIGTWARQVGESLGRSTSDFLKEESGILPSRPEVEAFTRAAEELGADADRLKARLDLLRRNA